MKVVYKKNYLSFSLSTNLLGRGGCLVLIFFKFMNLIDIKNNRANSKTIPIINNLLSIVFLSFFFLRSFYKRYQKVEKFPF